MILYKKLTGDLPFVGDTTKEIFNSLRHDEPNFTSPEFRRVSPLARDLIRRLLEKDPRKRICLQDALTHPWFASILAPPAPPVPAAPSSPPSDLPVGIEAPGGPIRPSTAPAPVAVSGSFFDPGAGSCTPPLGRVGGPDAAPPPVGGAVALLGAGRPHGGQVFEQVASARVFFLPPDELPRQQVQWFLDSFKWVELNYERLMGASDAAVAAVQWKAFCLGLKTLDDFLVDHASRDGAFFLGITPCLAEAATAPALFRMVPNLLAVRGIALLPACRAMRLTRLAAWLTEVLARTAEVCDVECLPAKIYVALARKLCVKYEGPPGPASLTTSPRSSLDVSHHGGSAFGGALTGCFTGCSKEALQLGGPAQVQIH